MCVRYAMAGASVKPKSASNDDGEITEGLFAPERFPGDLGEFVTHGGEVIEGRWGLQPSWTDDPNFGRKNAYNARAETVAEKPTFRQAFRLRRCLVPAAAFYERAEGRWLKVSPREGEAFLIAGLFEPGEPPTYTMVTTEPNPAIGELHDRMPVILTPEDAAAWTRPDADPRELHALLIPCAPEWTTIKDAGPVGGARRKTTEASLFDDL